MKTELLVIGGGPAGLGAAIEAARRGVATTLVDENEKAGGQLYKQIHKFFGSAEHYSGVRGFSIAELLLKEAYEAGVTILTGTRAIGVLRDGRVVLSWGEKSDAVEAQRIVLATGGKEKTLPFPGWTLPGIMSAGAAQTMCNVHRVLPGERVLMVGSGNVGLIVAYQLLQAGAEIAGLVEIQEQVGGYHVHAGKLRRRGIPFYLGYEVVEARGNRRVQEVDIRKRGSREIHTLQADTVCLSVGLSPRYELATMLGCSLYSSSLLGGHFPLHNHRMQSNREHVYVAGDAAGIEEANSSLDEGRLAGISIALDLGKTDKTETEESGTIVRARLEELRSGSHGLGRLKEKRAVLRAAGVQLPRKTEDPPAETGDSITAEALFARAKSCGHSLPLIDCPETIPCNPCVSVCPGGAITMDGICGLPQVDYELCTGCMRCAAACPGQAIFMVGPASDDARGEITIPWEQLPLPEKGDRVSLRDGNGEICGEGLIRRSRMPEHFNRTRLLTIEVPESQVLSVRSISNGGIVHESN